MSLPALLSIRWSALVPHMFAPAPMHESKSPRWVGEPYTHGYAREDCLHISGAVAEDDKYDVLLRAQAVYPAKDTDTLSAQGREVQNLRLTK
jgi:hypothetical protein